MTSQLRLASLVCSNSDILSALGVCDWVVAVDSFSDAPNLDQAIRIGPDLDIDVQALVAAKPDLVLASLSVPGMEKIVEEVQQAGLETLVLDPLSVNDTFDNMKEVGRHLGLEAKAEEVVDQLRTELKSLRHEYSQPPRVVVEWWPRPIIVATKESWVTDLLADLGAVNAFAEREGRSTPLHLEDVAAAKPDLIVCSWCGAQKLRPEVIEARGLGVPVIPVLESGLGRPGPRLIEGARQIAEGLKRFEP